MKNLNISATFEESETFNRDSEMTVSLEGVNGSGRLLIDYSKRNQSRFYDHLNNITIEELKFLGNSILKLVKEQEETNKKVEKTMKALKG